MHFMKGKVFMKQEVIDVILDEKEDKDILSFMIDGEDNKYLIDLNDDSSQLKIKEVFSKILEKLIDNDIILNFKCRDGYTKGLYIDVCREYIKDLNEEIRKVKVRLREVLDIDSRE